MKAEKARKGCPISRIFCEKWDFSTTELFHPTQRILNQKERGLPCSHSSCGACSS
jgi:hypothetical protein